MTLSCSEISCWHRPETNPHEKPVLLTAIGEVGSNRLKMHIGGGP
jgi:hypothetical protein